MNAGSVSKTTTDAQRQARYNSRKRVNTLALILAQAAMAFGVFWLIWILLETVRLGLGGMSLALFTQMTPAPNEVGGLAAGGPEAYPPWYSLRRMP